MKAPLSISEALWASYLDGSISPEDRDRLKEAALKDPAIAAELESLDLLLADLEESEREEVDADLLAMARSGLSRRLPKTAQEPAPLQITSPGSRQNKLLRYSGRVAALAAMLVMGMILARQLDSTGFTPITANSSQIANLDGASLRTASASPQETARPMLTSFKVSGLSVPTGEDVTIQLDQIQRYEIEGDADESEIQNYLSYIIRNDQDLKRRMLAVNALSGKKLSPQARETLIHVMAYDPDADMRLRTARLLSSAINESIVAQAFMKLMVDDPSSQLRNYAGEQLGILKQYEGSR